MLGLAGLCVLLALGLAACGGDEPAPVVQSPAPPPAPPPFQPQPVEVALGASSDAITLMTTEAGGFTLNGEDFASGTEVTAENGSAYALTLDAAGAWAAAFVPAAQTVALGTSGTVDLESTEDGGWTRAGEAFAGGSHVAENGNVYTLALVGGVWSTAYVPDTMAISGTGLTATSREDGSGYDVTSDLYDGTAALGADGAGDVTLGGAIFHVNMDEDGNLAGARFAAPIESPVVFANLATSLGDQILTEGLNQYPGLDADLAGRPQDAAVLARLDAVIEALSDADAFADAFESGGIFDGEYDLGTNVDRIDCTQGLTPEQLWNKGRTRASLLTGTTDFSRFGVWFSYYSRFASDNIMNRGSDLIQERSYQYTPVPKDGWEPFVYSRLPATDYTDTAGLPSSATMTFVGDTVAAQRSVSYTASVEARVRWDSSLTDRAGDLSVTLNDLIETLGEVGILHGRHPDHPNYDAAVDHFERVRSITFTAVVNNDMSFDSSGVARADRTLGIEYDTFDGAATATPMLNGNEGGLYTRVAKLPV